MLEQVRNLHRLGIPGLTLAEFAVAAWHVLEPTTPLVWNWHLEVMCAHVADLVLDLPSAPGRQATPQKLILNVPPGTCKSLIFSVFLPAWVWLWRPSWRALYASGAPSVVTRDSMRCRDLVKSEWYRRTFAPSWDISKDQDEKQHYANTARGWRKGVAAGMGVTGERADFLGVDDPNDAKEIHSKAHRRQINEAWWSTAFHNRIADPAKSKVGLIQQRLHEEDLTGYLLEREKGQWAHLVIQMEHELPGGQHPAPGDKPTWLGWSDPREHDGQLLQPARFTPEWLTGEKVALGTAGAAGQLQQRPTPASGNRFQKAWWRFWSLDGQRNGQRPAGCNETPAVRFNPTLDAWDECLGSWDCTFKEGDESDYVVGITVYRVGARRYVVDRERKQAGLGWTQDAIRRQYDRWAPQSIIVEDKANGSAAVETLAATVPGLIAVDPKGGKESRAAVLQPRVEAGNWFLPEGADWLGEWVEEFATFPLGRNDDQVDCASQAEARFIEDSDEMRARALLGMGRR